MAGPARPGATALKKMLKEMWQSLNKLVAEYASDLTENQKKGFLQLLSRVVHRHFYRKWRVSGHTDRNKHNINIGGNQPIQ